jgi:hypothetical protein
MRHFSSISIVAGGRFTTLGSIIPSCPVCKPNRHQG